MKTKLSNTIDLFFKKHPQRRVLLAFSGGPDSLALLHLLLDYQKRDRSLALSIAHVNHGWRPESLQEEKEIEKLAKELNLPLHIRQLSPTTMKGNLECACREARLAFFSDLSHKHGYEAILLGHHSDDLAETVLKRIFEGASLSRLSAIQQLQKMTTPHNNQTLTLLRPLLEIKKQELIDWLDTRHLKGFYDSTNDDPKFLRTKLRKNIIPHLDKHFGKKIAAPLCRLSQEAQELNHYLLRQIEPYLSKLVDHSNGILLDVSETPIDPFLLRYLVKHLCNECSYDTIKKITDLLISKKANRRVKHLRIDKGRLIK